MIIDCISDLHGCKPALQGGDLLIVAGDLTGRDTIIEYMRFFEWISSLDYRKKIFISGNHDGQAMSQFDWGKDVEYLYDSGTEFDCLKIWGSPWSLYFKGVNPKCTAFMGKESDLEKKYNEIPKTTDILITHTPPYMILDEIYDHNLGCEINAGSMALRHCIDVIRPKLCVFGHVHEWGGKEILLKHQGQNTICVNASILNERYEHVNKPVRVIL